MGNGKSGVFMYLCIYVFILVYDFVSIVVQCRSANISLLICIHNKRVVGSTGKCTGSMILCFMSRYRADPVDEFLLAVCIYAHTLT